MNYFTEKNNFFHGIMFHHFHDKIKHSQTQGSIDKEQFYKIIEFVGRKNILNSDEFLLRCKNNSLKNNDLCITFDDGVKSQYDIALPVLNDLDIKAFFFINSSPYTQDPNLLEIYRYFRSSFYKDIDTFYKDFYSQLNLNLKDFFNKNRNQIDIRKQKFPFYSIEDIKFRIVRDLLLGQKDYKTIMLKMFKSKNFNYKNFLNKVFISEAELLKMKIKGHTFGLHSHSHPTRLVDLTYEQQKDEYAKNLTKLAKLIKVDKADIKTMSHPSGSYNNDTLKILEKLGIELGFIQVLNNNKKSKSNYSYLEISRQDQSNILKILN